MASATTDLRLPPRPQGHHRPLAGAKLYCWVKEAHACEQLAQCRYRKADITLAVKAETHDPYATAVICRVVLARVGRQQPTSADTVGPN